MTLSYPEALSVRAQLVNLPLPDGLTRAEFNELTAGGVRDALFSDLAAIADRRNAPKEASVAISQAKDWAAVAKRIRDRDEFRRAHPWAVREVTR